MAKAKTATALEVEGALCAWECMLEWHGDASRKDDPEWRQVFNRLWNEQGTSGMRHTSIRAGAIASETYGLMAALGHEFHSPYDWEFVPAVLMRLDWSALIADSLYNGPAYRPNVSEILREMMSATPDDFETAHDAWFVRARGVAQQVYCYEALIDDNAERFEAAFKAGQDPRDAVNAVAAIAEKYDLIPASDWL